MPYSRLEMTDEEIDRKMREHGVPLIEDKVAPNCMLCEYVSGCGAVHSIIDQHDQGNSDKIAGLIEEFANDYPDLPDPVAQRNFLNYLRSPAVEKHRRDLALANNLRSRQSLN